MDPTVDALRAMLAIPVNAWMASCLGAAVLAIVVAFVLTARVAKSPAGTEPMRAAGRAIHVGARSYVRVALAACAILGVVGAVLVGVAFHRADEGWSTAIAFGAGLVATGAAASLAARAAASGAERTVSAAAARGLGAALRIAYASGAAGGLFAAGFAVAALTLLHLIDGQGRSFAACALGAATAALVHRVGGGVFAKASTASVALAIRSDQAIPDDSPTNGGAISAAVGDSAANAGGFAAGLAANAIACIAAAIALGGAAWTAAERSGRADLRAALESLAAGPATLAVFPVALVAAGIVAAFAAAPFVRTENERRTGGMLHRAVMIGAVVMVLAASVLTFSLGLARPEVTQALTGAAKDAADPARYDGPAGVLWATLTGLVLGVLLGRLSEWHTSDARSSVRRLAEESAAGPQASVLNGLALGMLSSAGSAVAIAAAAGIGHYVAGAYGIAAAAAGLVSILAVQVAVHACGGVAAATARAAGMARVGPETRGRADALDAAASRTGVLGQSTSAAAAAMTVLAVLAALRDAYDRLHPSAPLRLDLADVDVLAGLLVGSVVPLVFAALVVRAVNRVARPLADEILRHFHAARPAGEETPTPDHARFVRGGARRSMRRLIPAVTLAGAAPLLAGFSSFGVRGLAGFVLGAAVTATGLAFTLGNAGAAWHNAKRYVASGVFGGKGSPAYRASSTGDGVGEPFRDAAAPALHTLVLVLALAALLLLPFFPG